MLISLHWAPSAIHLLQALVLLWVNSLTVTQHPFEARPGLNKSVLSRRRADGVRGDYINANTKRNVNHF